MIFTGATVLQFFARLDATATTAYPGGWCAGPIESCRFYADPLSYIGAAANGA